MITLAQTTQSTTAKPSAVFSLWADINHWTDFDSGIEWAKLDQPFKAGSHYTIKPQGGPTVHATIEVVEPNNRFIDVSHLLGAKLRFDHSIVTHNNNSEVTIIMTLEGPLVWLWKKILGKNQQTDLEKSTASLIAKAEQL